MTRPCSTLGLLMCQLQEVTFTLTIDVFKIETIFTPSGKWSTVDFYTMYQCFGEAYCLNFRVVFLGYPQNPDDGSSMLFRIVCNYTPMSKVSCILHTCREYSPALFREIQIFLKVISMEIPCTCTRSNTS